MKIKEAMGNDRAYGLVRITSKHRETASRIIRDEEGNLLPDFVLTEIIATLIAKSYSESEL